MIIGKTHPTLYIINYFKATAWKELVLACIGEQFSSQCSENDEITGISVSIREREDLIQIWNSNSIEADRATVIEKIKNELLPEVQFSAVFYKGDFLFYGKENSESSSPCSRPVRTPTDP